MRKEYRVPPSTATEIECAPVRGTIPGGKQARYARTDERTAVEVG
jgi:hypothetical protein